MRKVYECWVYDPLVPGRMKHAVHRYYVLAKDLPRAKQALVGHYELTKEHVVRGRLYDERDDGKGAIIMSDHWANFITKDEMALIKGEPAKPVPKVREPKPSTKPLGENQAYILHSLVRGPYPGSGWLWDTPSGTVRLLEGLRLRCLVDLKDGVYSINNAGRAAILAPRPEGLSPCQHDPVPKMRCFACPVKGDGYCEQDCMAVQASAPRPDAPTGQIKELSSNGGREGV